MLTPEQREQKPASMPTPELIRDLLSSDGRARPGDEQLCGLADAIRHLDPDLKMDIAAGLYTYALDRLDMAEHAKERAQFLPPDEFRARNLVTAERLARRWREAVHA